MGTTGANIPDLNVNRIAKKYILTEFRKLFSDITDSVFWESFNTSLEGLDKRTTHSTFLGLLSGISEGIRLNSIHEYLTNDSYYWTLENISSEKILFTGMSPEIDKYTLEICKGSPGKFLELWKKDKILRQKFISAGISPVIKNDIQNIPIIVFEKDKKLAVLDGMHRTLASVISEEKNILGWVGKTVKLNGKPLINSSMSMFLWRIWKNAKNRDDDLKNALKRISIEILIQYRNGHESLINRVVERSNDKEFKNIFSYLK